MKRIDEDIRSGKLKRLYLLYGEENYLKKLYKNKLKHAVLEDTDTMNFTYWEGKGIDVKEVIAQADTMPFFAERRLLLLENSGFFKGSCPELADYIPNIPEETVMVFVESEVDSKTKTFKAAGKNGLVVEAKILDSKDLKTWILLKLKKEGKRISGHALQVFMEKVGESMENVSNELEKLICYTYGKNNIDLEDVLEICAETTENKIFHMLRFMNEKKQKDALRIYYDLLAHKEAVMRILASISSQFNQMLMLKDMDEQGMDQNSIIQKSGMWPRQAGRSLEQSRKYTKEQLLGAVKDCVKTEEEIKTGKLMDELAVEMIIIKYSE